MKTNAIFRIIIWSLVLVVLVGILGVVLLGSFTTTESAITENCAPAIEAPTVFEEESVQQLNVQATVTATAVNVRSAPSSDSPIIGYVEQGDAVLIGRGETVDGQEWIWISSPVTGWMMAEYVDPLEDVVFHSSEALRAGTDSGSSSAVTATVTDELNIRSAPMEDTAAIGLLQPGDTVTIGRQENINGEAWAYITSPEAGWVMAKYLQTEAAASSGAAYNGDISLDAKQIREIEIEWAAGHITIEPADVAAIQVSESSHSDPKYAMVWKQNNDKLTIRFSENSNLNFGVTLNNVISKDLTILVPMGWECDSLDIDAASATVDIQNLAIKEVDFDGASGTCNFVNCVIEELDLDTASGDIYFSGSLTTLDCDAASASVFAVFDNVPSRIDMDSMSGDLDITLPSTAGFTVTMDGLSTDFFSDFGFSQAKDGSCYRGNGACKITMDAMSGDIYIREYKASSTEPEAAAVPTAHIHTDACTTDPDSCPDSTTHHTEPSHN